jgi:ribonuclease D
VTDASRLAAAKALPKSKRDLAAMKEFNGRASRSQLDRWWAAIEAGLATTDLPVNRPPGDGMPPPRVWAEKNPEADGRLKRARAAVIARAEELSIPVENVLTPDTLRRVAWSPPAQITEQSVGAALTALAARPWQVEATAQLIARAFVEVPQQPETPEEPSS